MFYVSCENDGVFSILSYITSLDNRCGKDTCSGQSRAFLNLNPKKQANSKLSSSPAMWNHPGVSKGDSSTHGLFLLFFFWRFFGSEETIIRMPEIHADYRLWVTCEITSRFPIGLLHLCIKVTQEISRFPHVQVLIHLGLFIWGCSPPKVVLIPHSNQGYPHINTLRHISMGSTLSTSPLPVG